MTDYQRFDWDYGRKRCFVEIRADHLNYSVDDKSTEVRFAEIAKIYLSVKSNRGAHSVLLSFVTIDGGFVDIGASRWALGDSVNVEELKKPAMAILEAIQKQRPDVAAFTGFRPKSMQRKIWYGAFAMAFVFSSLSALKDRSSDPLIILPVLFFIAFSLWSLLWWHTRIRKSEISSLIDQVRT